MDLDALLAAVNRRLPDLLPAELRGRMKTEVTPRLVRHYTTLGLLDPPEKAGRENRYGERHLLQLLVLRKLQGQGFTPDSIERVLRGKSDADLRALTEGGSRLEIAPSPASNPALDYLSGLRARSGPEPVRPVAFDAGMVAFDHPPEIPPLAAPAPVPRARPTRWLRVPVEPDLELLVREDFRPPNTPSDRAALTDLILRLLDDALPPQRKK